MRMIDRDGLLDTRQEKKADWRLSAALIAHFLQAFEPEIEDTLN